VDKKGNGYIGTDDLILLFENIGASNTVTRNDIEDIITEFGDDVSKTTISTKKMLQIM
jgi:Ca2+-binding EF-hand superfamily protein